MLVVSVRSPVLGRHWHLFRTGDHMISRTNLLPRRNYTFMLFMRVNINMYFPAFQCLL